MEGIDQLRQPTDNGAVQLQGATQSSHAIQEYHQGLRNYVYKHLRLPIASSKDANVIVEMFLHIFQNFDRMWTIFPPDDTSDTASLLTPTWLFAHILPLLCSSSCTGELHTNTMKLLGLIVQSIHRRDVRAMKAIVGEILLAMESLHDISTSITNNSLSSDAMPIHVACFEGQFIDPTHYPCGVLLEINSRQQCQAFQHLLCSLLPPTCLKYSGEQLPSLWKLVSSQLLDASNNRLIRSLLGLLLQLEASFDCPEQHRDCTVRALTSVLLRLADGHFSRQNIEEPLAEAFMRLLDQPWAHPHVRGIALPVVARRIGDFAHNEALRQASARILIDSCRHLANARCKVSEAIAMVLANAARMIARNLTSFNDDKYSWFDVLKELHRVVSRSWISDHEEKPQSKRRRLDTATCSFMTIPRILLEQARSVAGSKSELVSSLRLIRSAAVVLEEAAGQGVDFNDTELISQFWEVYEGVLPKAILSRNTSVFEELFAIAHVCLRWNPSSMQQHLDSTPQNNAILISSLPWLLSHASRTKLSPEEFVIWSLLPEGTRELIAQSSADASLEKPLIVFELLAAAVKPSYATWIHLIFRESVTDTSDEVASSAVQVLPLLFANSHDIDCTPILERLPELEKRFGVHSSLASVFGRIVCGADQQLTINNGGTFTCAICEKPGKGGTGRCASVNTQLLLSLLQSVDAHVRALAAAQLGQVFVHVCQVRDDLEFLTACMNTLCDSDRKVRVTFGQQLPMALPAEDGVADMTQHPLVVRLSEAVAFARQANDDDLIDTLLCTMGALGKVANGQVQFYVLTGLLTSLAMQKPFERAAAFEQLRAIANFKNISTEALIQPFHKEISHFLVDRMCQGEHLPLASIASLLEHKRDNQFLKETLKYTLPYLFRRTQRSNEQLKRLAEYVGDTVQSMLIQNGHHIFVGLLLDCSKEDSKAAFDFFTSQTEGMFTIKELLRSHWYDVLNEVVLRLDGPNDQPDENAIQGLKSALSLMRGKKWQNCTLKELRDKLQPALLSILLFLTRKLQQSGSHLLKSKTQALHGLIGFINTVGEEHLASCRVKVIATLKLCLDEPSLAPLCCRAWRCFVHNLDDTSLGSVFLQIVVTMLPLMETCPDRAAEVYEHLIVTKAEQFREFFSELYYMPDLPQLAEVNRVLRREQKKSGEQPSLQSELAVAAKGVDHESLQVRLRALEKLIALLRERQRDVLELLSGSDVVSPLLSKLFTSVLQGCRSTSAEERTLCAEAMGYLGAVDPSRFVSKRAEGRSDQLHLGLVDQALFSQLVSSHLVPAFLSAENAKAQDRAAVALQKCLSAFGCTGDLPVEGARVSSRMTKPESFWHSLPQADRDIIHPYLSTTFNLQLRPRAELQKPIFSSARQHSFTEWIAEWTCDLIDQLTQLKPNDNETKIFQACRGIVRDDLKTCLFLSPFICTNIVVANSKESAIELENELRDVLKIAASTNSSSNDDRTRMAAQTVFSVIEHMSKVLRILERLLVRSKNSRRAVVDPAVADKVATLQAFLDSIPHQLVADASFHCDSFERALLYFEQHLRATKMVDYQSGAGHSPLEPAQARFLQRIYSQLQEIDGMIGVATVRTETSLEEQIVDFRSAGQWTQALGCLERALQLDPSNLNNHLGFVECLMNLGHLQTTTTHLTGIAARHPEWETELNDRRYRPAWCLSDWDCLTKSLEIPPSGAGTFERSVGQLFIDVLHDNHSQFLLDLKSARDLVIAPLSAVSMEAGSYQRGYLYVLQLQILREFQDVFADLLDPSRQSNRKEALATAAQRIGDWEGWLQITQPTFAMRETLLSVRRASLALLAHRESDLSRHLDLVEVTSESWLQTARNARHVQLLPTAYSAVLQAQQSSGLDLAMEAAHILWDGGQQHEALINLQQAIQSVSKSQRKTRAYAQAMLVVGNWMTETSRFQSQDVIKQYKAVTESQPKWERGYYHLAKYYDSLLEFDSQKKTSKEPSLLPSIMENYGHCLQFGSTFIFQALPRLLTLWLQYGARLPDTTSKSSKSSSVAMEKADSKTLDKLNSCMKKLISNLPAFQFLTALPQLTSRICHPNSGVFSLLELIIGKVLKQYPQQTLWTLMAVAESTHAFRKRRCEGIFRDNQVGKPLKAMIAQFKSLTTQLLALSNKNVPRDIQVIHLSRDFAKLKRMGRMNIIIPVTSAMTVLLPGEGTDASEHDAFPDGLPTIHGFDEKIQLLPSLQRPKKIKIIGSDGREYIFLCKPKDDLRKDCRLMEFHSLINKLLQKDPETRRRQLRIRTYAVVPLNEECGLLEWVSNTLPFRNIVHDIYKSKSMYTRGAEVKSIMNAKYAPKLSKKEVFVKKLLPRFPPVFSEWFVTTFPEPTRWYASRLAYARACAVMSMVGYVVGLGDRHGENILFDSTTGECVHVDFNCLFCKGEQFDTPERVPFRLTHNMVEALGVTGYEGVFRKTCEVTLRVMRSECTSLENVLTTFIYDPLVEWSSGRHKSVTSSAEFQNEQAKETLRALQNRLLGRDKTKGLPLSIEGQVHHLIQEATSIDNLCQMYIGWSAYT